MLAGDHFVWPTLVGGVARLPFLFAFVGIFGGIATFGLVGLFVGPVIMAALLTVWREWIVPSARTEETDLASHRVNQAWISAKTLLCGLALFVRNCCGPSSAKGKAGSIYDIAFAVVLDPDEDQVARESIKGIGQS
jgi:hypothetical protein